MRQITWVNSSGLGEYLNKYDLYFRSRVSTLRHQRNVFVFFFVSNHLDIDPRLEISRYDLSRMEELTWEELLQVPIAASHDSEFFV